MAIDPALLTHDVINELQGNLMNYVLQNRRMQQQDRQFNADLNLRKSQLDEDIRRFDLGEARLGRNEELQLEGLKADRDMLSQIISRNKVRKLREDYDASKTSYVENMMDVNLGSGGLFSGDYWKSLNPFAGGREEYYRKRFEEITPDRPELPELQLPSTRMIPQVGLNNLMQPQQSNRSLLNMLMLQGG